MPRDFKTIDIYLTNQIYSIPNTVLLYSVIIILAFKLKYRVKVKQSNSESLFIREEIKRTGNRPLLHILLLKRILQLVIYFLPEN